MNANSELRIQQAATGFVVSGAGRGTLRQSPLLERFAKRCLACERCDLFVDLTGCSYLDSTFAGCLVSLCKQFSSQASQFAIVATPADCTQLFGQLGLRDYFPVLPSRPETTGAYLNLTEEEDETLTIANHVLQCHRELSDVEGPQQELFRQLVSQIEAELDEKTR